MQGWIRGFLERLAFRLMSVLTAKVEAQLELELADVRAQLLERAASFQADAAPSVAERLTQASTRMGEIDMAKELQALECQPEAGDGQRDGSQERKKIAPTKTKPASSPANRGRGRPRKVPEESSLSLTNDSPTDQTLSSTRQTDGE